MTAQRTLLQHAEEKQSEAHQGLPQPRTSAYERNVGRLERALSIGGGLGLIAAGLRRRGFTGVLLAGLGAGLIGRGASGYCPLYDKARMSTAPSRRAGVPDNLGVKVEQSLLLNRPREELFRFFRDFRNLPGFLRRIERIDILDDRRSHWVARLPGDRVVEWDVRIINEHPNELIAWESLPGSPIESAGSVRFTPAEFGEGTEIRITLEYNRPGNFLTTLRRRLFGSEALFLQDDLLDLKLYLEENLGQERPLSP